MKKVNFNALKNIQPPGAWLEKAFAAQHKKKPPLFSTYIIGAAASLVIVSIVVLTLLFSGGDTPVSPQNALPVHATTSGTTVPPDNGEASAVTAAMEPQAAEAPATVNTIASAQSAADTTVPATVNTIASEQPAEDTTVPAGRAAPAAVPTQPAFVQPTAAPQKATELPQTFQPLNTTAPEPLDPGAGDPDLPATYPPQPLWHGKIEIEISPTSPLFNSDAVYIHFHNWQTGEEPVPVYSESGRMTVSFADDQKKTVSFVSDGQIRQYDQYHAMIYDRQGQVQDIYFCVRPNRVDRVTLPKCITFKLE